MSRLEGRVAVITGAASGIGAGMVRRWLEEGACVVGCDIKDSMPIEHERAVYVKGDLSRYEDAKNVIDTAVKTFGKIDSMVNCAGIALLGGLEDLSVEDMQKEFAVNVFGMFHICKAAIPYLKEQKGATIVNIASDCAFKTMKGWIGYGPSKAAVIQLSRCIASYDHLPCRGRRRSGRLTRQLREPVSDETNRPGFRHGKRRPLPLHRRKLVHYRGNDLRQRRQPDGIGRV